MYHCLGLGILRILVPAVYTSQENIIPNSRSRYLLPNSSTWIGFRTQSMIQLLVTIILGCDPELDSTTP